MTKLESWLMQACQASGLEVDIGFLAVVGDRKPIQSVARIRGLGDANGMLIVRDYDQVYPLLDDIRLAGYGFSVLDEPGDEESFDLHSYQEMFHDWGWPRRTEKGSHHL